jgi:hypothetical protein
VVVNTLYLPPIAFFANACFADKIEIESCENFIKQTYRNRCSVYSANGKSDLTVYLEKCRRNHLPLKEVKISYTQPWNKIHWRAIVSAYNNSPFFMYYEYDFVKFYDREYKWLLDYNTQLLSLCLKLLRIEKEIVFTESYKHEYPNDIDFRNRFTPFSMSEIEFIKYPQVFDFKYGFIPGLSIIDLLFNRGPAAEDYIRHLAEKKT